MESITVTVGGCSKDWVKWESACLLPFGTEAVVNMNDACVGVGKWEAWGAQDGNEDLTPELEKHMIQWEAIGKRKINPILKEDDWFHFRHMKWGQIL